MFCSGDLEWFADSRNLPRWNENHPCGHCAVHKSAMFDFKNIAEAGEPLEPAKLGQEKSLPSFSKPSGHHP